MISIINLSWVLIGLYTLYFLVFQKKKNLLLFLTSIVLFVPKVNLISIGNISTGIRVDDVIIALTFFLILLTHNITTNRALNQFIKLLAFVCLANLCSVCFSILFLNNNNLLWAVLVLIRKVEYFVLIFVGYYACYSQTSIDRDEAIYRTISILNCAFFLIAILQMQGICGYVIKGEVRDTFSRAAVGTFNGYYEYALFLCFSNIFYFLNLKNGKHKVFSLLLCIATIIFIYFSTSRTSLLVTIIIDVILVLRWIFQLSRSKVQIAIIAIVVACSVAFILLPQMAFVSNTRFDSITISGMWKTLKTNWENASFEGYLNYFGSGVNPDLYIGSGGDLSAALRFYKWGAIFKQFLKYPLFGYGFGVSNVVDGNYFRLLGESGIIGTFLWLTLLFSVLKYEKNREDRILAPVCFYITIALLLNSIFIDSFESSKVMEMYWFIIGCSIEKNGKNSCNIGVKCKDETNTSDNPSCRG